MGGHAQSNLLAVDQPSRAADHNRSLADQADPATEEMLLPTLEEGITLLDVEGGRGVPVLQSLVLDHLLLHDGPAFWVDANGHATTTTLAQIAPSQRLLDRIHVARGFTAYQHYGIVCDLPEAVNQSIRASAGEPGTANAATTPHAEETAPRAPAFIVAPAVDAQYREDDTLGEAHAKTLQARTLARLRAYAEAYDAPVLVTRNERNERNEQNEFAEPIARVSDQYLVCEQTRMGPRILGDEFETLVYPVDGGPYYQTTFAYWRQVLAARATAVGMEPTAPESSAPTPEGVGTGVTAEGETVTPSADPLVDAWTAPDAGGR